jgi:hypothetical protein
MRWLFVAFFVAVSQAPAKLPPAYPRAGAASLLDNDAVQVWQIAWLKGKPSPMHRHIYDLLGVYYEPGDRIIISPEGARRPVSDEGVGHRVSRRKGIDAHRGGRERRAAAAVFVELKRAGFVRRGYDGRRGGRSAVKAPRCASTTSGSGCGSSPTARRGIAPSHLRRRRG